MNDTPRIIMFADIVEENGKTIRENNMAREHKYPIGTLVEVAWDEYFGGCCGMAVKAHLHVISHNRDCDGTPLYTLASKHPDEWEERFNMTLDEFLGLPLFHPKRVFIEHLLGMYTHGHGEDSLTPVPVDEHSAGGRYIPTVEKDIKE